MNRKDFLKSISILALTPSILKGNIMKREAKVPLTTSWEINQGECSNCGKCYVDYPGIFTEKNNQYAGLNENTDCGTVGGTNNNHLYGVGNGCSCEEDIMQAKANCPSEAIIELGAQIR
jgi:ferredoxin